MNEGKFIAIQNYLEEIASQNKQVIGLLQRTNELLAKLPAPAALTAEIINLDAPLTGTLETEPPPAPMLTEAMADRIALREENAKPKSGAKKGK